MSSDGMVVANAPCSYGAFEITVGVDPNVPPALELLEAVSDAGYAGIDLGPLGYLGDADKLPARLHEPRPGPRRRLLRGPVQRARAAARGAGAAGRSCSTCSTPPRTRTRRGRPAARPTLADAGSASRARYPGRAAHADHELGLGRRRLEALRRGAWHGCWSAAATRGYEPTFHPHTATYVEAPWEIDRLLSMTDASVCLDTGPPADRRRRPASQAVRDWGARINHVHLKDAQTRRASSEIVADRAPVRAIWERGAFCQLGTGDVALDDVLEQLAGMTTAAGSSSSRTSCPIPPTRGSR